MSSRAICVALASVCFCSVAQAQVYLNGVVGYNADAAGSSISEPGEYDNLLGTSNAEVVLNGTPRGTVHTLNLGDNLFVFTGMGGYNALVFYFSATNTPFNRPFGSAPDLAAFGTNQTPGAGALVQTNGQFSGTAAYSGATSFALGNYSISISAFGSGPTAGTFIISVIPAPSSAALLGLAGVLAVRRRR